MNTILVSAPEKMASERSYICSVIFGDFLGLNWKLLPTSQDYVRIACDGYKGEILIPDTFFQMRETDWLSDNSLPNQPLSLWGQDSRSLGMTMNLVKSTLPIIFGNSGQKLLIKQNSIQLPIDILGSAFFMLSRYEEAVSTERDMHDRFPATASLSFKNRFIDRPIVDEYVEVLWECMRLLWKHLKRKRHRPQKLISCDVDSPYEAYTTNWSRLIRRAGGDLLKRHNFADFLTTIRNYYYTTHGDFSADPNNTFDWIMDVNEKAGNKITFYFLVSQTETAFDSHYSIKEPRIRTLMRRIHERGHEIGLHGSYGSYKNGTLLTNEARLLRQVMDEEGIYQPEIGSRQHYLRWSTPETARLLDAAEVAYDSSLSYADHPGFRCGTCHEYPMFDLNSRKPLKLKQRPLILMETSVIDGHYMGLGYGEDSLELMNRYKSVCQKFGGDFTLLWHNSHFRTNADKLFYEDLIG